VLANLIGNAFDATRHGGRIVLRERAAVHPMTGQHGVRITLADTGHGIPEEVKGHLFEAFKSTKGSTGSGLGLWISKGIIEKHCGSIQSRSSTRPGRSGTVFSIFIPVSE
jgi:signal transduction histidine kinase